MTNKEFFGLSSLLLAMILCFFVVVKLPAKEPADRVYQVYNQEEHLKELIAEIAGPHDLTETITTLAKIESQFNTYIININGGEKGKNKGVGYSADCGLVQVNSKSFLKRFYNNKRPSQFAINKACSDLIKDDRLNITAALEEVLYWKSIHCPRAKCTRSGYERIVRSYNTGWGYNSAKADEYWQRFRAAYNELYGKKSKNKVKEATKYVIQRIK